MLVVFSLGVVYALPNIYPPDFAVQISTESADGTFTERALNAAASRLEEESVEYFGAEMQENGGLNPVSVTTSLSFEPAILFS